MHGQTSLKFFPPLILMLFEIMEQDMSKLQQFLCQKIYLLCLFSKQSSWRKSLNCVVSFLEQLTKYKEQP